MEGPVLALCPAANSVKLNEENLKERTRAKITSISSLKSLPSPFDHCEDSKNIPSSHLSVVDYPISPELTACKEKPQSCGETLWQKRVSKYIRAKYLTHLSTIILERRQDTSNLIGIDSRSHLEVSDPKHRYGKNLRLYFEEWCRLFPRKDNHNRLVNGNSEGVLAPACSLHTMTPYYELSSFEAFFQWLDAANNVLSLPSCPRDVLDGDTVTYCRSSLHRHRYATLFDKRGRLHRLQARMMRASFCSAEEEMADNNNSSSLLTTGKAGHIFVAKDGVIYTHEKKVDAPPRFHHSSFFAGDVVEAAGILVCEAGEKLTLYPHSGHYRPTDKHFLNLLLLLSANNVDLNTVTVDVQRTLRTARLVLPGGEKCKKKDSAWMWGAPELFDFLMVKVSAWERGLFAELLSAVLERVAKRKAAESTIDQMAWEGTIESIAQVIAEQQLHVGALHPVPVTEDDEDVVKCQ